jgi:hypothetical protein
MVERWERDGRRPVVGVWTAKQTAAFHRQVRGHRLYALFHLVALRGELELWCTCAPVACQAGAISAGRLVGLPKRLASPELWAQWMKSGIGYDCGMTEGYD